VHVINIGIFMMKTSLQIKIHVGNTGIDIRAEM